MEIVLLRKALSSSQLVVLPSVDWPRFTAHFADAVPGLLREVAAVPAAPTVANPVVAPDLRSELTDLARR